MADSFVIQEVYVSHGKKTVRSDVKPLLCHVCKKELNGISITAKNIDGKMVFLCSFHYAFDPHKIALVN
ncbi:MAG: hypothetical protein KGH95_08095 [Thaumarchaeota archaeon]|nr:hypothetical protein [Nitrososphaerota archaeon]